MKEFIGMNLPSILIVIAVVIILLLLYKGGHKKIAQQIILNLVVQAEKALGSKTGELKYSYVVDSFYSKLPSIIRFLYTKKEVNEMIEASVAKLKEVLASGATLTGYDDEKLINELNHS